MDLPRDVKWLIIAVGASAYVQWFLNQILKAIRSEGEKTRALIDRKRGSSPP